MIWITHKIAMKIKYITYKLKERVPKYAFEILVIIFFHSQNLPFLQTLQVLFKSDKTVDEPESKGQFSLIFDMILDFEIWKSIPPEFNLSFQQFS